MKNNSNLLTLLLLCLLPLQAAGYNKAEVQAVEKIVYLECRSCPDWQKLAVAKTIVKRSHNPKKFWAKSKNLVDVVKAKRGRYYQFETAPLLEQPIKEKAVFRKIQVLLACNNWYNATNAHEYFSSKNGKMHFKNNWK